MQEMTVGEVAKRTGLSVRALHHYDEIGLLRPSRRSPAGYRLYDPDDLARLLEILLLRDLGLSLEEIKASLDGHRLGETISLHIERLRERIAGQRRLLRQLEKVAARLDSAGRLSIADLTFTMETLTMHEKYFTPEQLAQLESRGRELGTEKIAEAEAEWPGLIAKARAALERGDEPTSPEVQQIARRWKELTEAFTGGDPAIARSVKEQYREEPELRRKTGLDSALFEYMGRAMASL